MLKRLKEMLERGQLDAAEENFRRMLATAPNHPFALLGVACCARLRGNAAAALAGFEAAYAAHPGQIEVAQELVALLVDEGRLGEADTILAQFPDDYEIVMKRAAVARRRDVEGAIACFEQAARLEPDRHHPFVELAKLLRDHQRFAEADTALNRAEARLRARIERAPREISGYTALIGLLSQSQQQKAADAVFEAARTVLGEPEELLREQIRAKQRVRDWPAAMALLEQLTTADPANLFALTAMMHIAMSMRRYDLATVQLEKLQALQPENIETRYAAAQMALETGAYGAAQSGFEALLADHPSHHPSWARLAQMALRDGDLGQSASLLSRAIESAPDGLGYRLNRGRLWLSLDRLDEALADANRVLMHEPFNSNATRIVAAVEERRGETPELTVCVVLADETQATEAGVEDVTALLRGFAEVVEILVVPTDEGLPALLAAALSAERKGAWVCLGTVSDALTLAACLGRAAQRNALRMVEGMYGRALLQGDVGHVTLYRREMLNLLEQAATFRGLSPAALMQESGNRIRTVAIAPDGMLERLPPPVPPAQDGVVFLISGQGITLFGGGEHYLRDIAGLYRQHGFAPLIVGMRGGVGSPVRGEQDGFTFADLPAAPGAIVGLALAEHPAIVHVLSGLGHEVVVPLRFFHVATIYGTHYWRDMFEEIDGYHRLEEHVVPRPEFSLILRYATIVYSNSIYTAGLKRQHFGVATPVNYALSHDVDEVPLPDGTYALLVNARADKGFDLLLQVAALVPEVPFLVIASQSPRSLAEAAVASAGLANVTVIDKVDGLEAIYRQTRVALVPSYAFRETFSRVVIEAHRLGIPVIGSDRGNVPYLLAEAGVSLPEDPMAWAAELQRLYADGAYHAERRRLAIENSQRYAFAGQAERLGRFIRFAQKRILVGVGAGIGNIVQATPLIRRLAEHYGRPVDVVVNEDFADCALLLANAPWVSMVFTLDRIVVRREYDLVYLTHSFGNLQPAFNANMVVAARQRFDYMHANAVHETIFNLNCAHDLLGLPYEAADAAKYFVGRYVRPPAAHRRYVGIHAGSKGGEWEGGRWLNKRWPYYQELAAVLTARGYEVASFGAPDEYVPGTVDLTGTPLSITIENIARCIYFIANDSGLMHVADALGVPLTAIFGPTAVDHAGPLSPDSHVVELKKPCAPCVFFPERFATCRCIAELPVEKVLESIKL